jgi:hypothetical protein
MMHHRIKNENIAAWLKHDSENWGVKNSIREAATTARAIPWDRFSSDIHAVLDATLQQLQQRIFPMLQSRMRCWQHLTIQVGREAAQRYSALFLHTTNQIECKDYARSLWPNELDSAEIFDSQLLTVFDDIEERLSVLFEQSDDPKISIRADWPRVPRDKLNNERIIIPYHPVQRVIEY